MSKACRIIQGGQCEITQGYHSGHLGMDIVNKNYTLGWLTAHSAGTVVAVEKNCNYNTYPNGACIYGNFVKIKHDNGYYTLYGHIAYGTVKVSVGQRVSKGQVIGYMGNTGYSNGGHVHWEVRNTSDTKINPTNYLNTDLPSNVPSSDINSKSVDELAKEVISGKYGNGQDRVNALGSRYREVQDRVNQLLSGNTDTTKYLSNKNYNGYSIVDGLKGIGVDSSFSYRSKLAQINGIANYVGSAEQNLKMLELLKNGRLKSV